MFLSLLLHMFSYKEKINKWWSILPSPPSFPFLSFPVSRFAKNCRFFQLLAFCLKSRRPETWTGFQPFFEYHISIQIHAKKNDQIMFSE